MSSHEEIMAPSVLFIGNKKEKINIKIKQKKEENDFEWSTERTKRSLLTWNIKVTTKHNWTHRHSGITKNLKGSKIAFTEKQATNIRNLQGENQPD